MFNRPPAPSITPIDSALEVKGIEKGWKVKWMIKKIIMAIVAMMGLAGPTIAQSIESGQLSPEAAKILAENARKKLEQIGIDYTNKVAFLEKRAELKTNIENTVKSFTVEVDSAMGEDMREIIGRPLEVHYISNGNGLAIIQDLILVKDSTVTVDEEHTLLDRKKGDCNYELKASLFVDVNGDGILSNLGEPGGDLVGSIDISNSKEVFTYQEIFDGKKTNTEATTLHSWQQKIASKFRNDQVQNGYFKEIMEKGGVIWWAEKNLKDSEKKEVQADFVELEELILQK